MPARRRIHEPKEDEPFIPAEPWWRRRRHAATAPGRGGGEKGTRAGRRNTAVYQVTPPVSPNFGGSGGRGHLSPNPSPGKGKEGRVERAVGRLTLRRGAALVVAAAVVAGLAFLVTSDRLAVTREDTLIQGNGRIPAEEIYAAAAIEGVNIFQIHAGRAAERIRQVPGVAQAAVYLRLPHEVTIFIWEEQPIAIWRRGETTLWVAASGAVVPARGPAPALTLVDPQAVAGEEGRLQPQVLANLKAISLNFAKEAGLEVNDLYYGVREGFYFRSPDGWTVYLGHEGPMDAKLAAFRELRSSPAARHAVHRIVDLRVKDRAQIR